jgi:CMP-N-acetylneuraminic acid synthetase/quercetin dioxygenase-like cupin family protein
VSSRHVLFLRIYQRRDTFMGKIIAMVPARLGSQRVKKKNLRLIKGKPLISYIIESAIEADCFDEIYINSESDIFGEIAKCYNILFYKRPEIYASNKATNDEFSLDFMKNIEGDILIQLLPTSPLITAEEIRDFTKQMLEQNYDSLISVEDKQIACVYNSEPVNFDKLKVNPPSQEMAPVRAYATTLMGWKYNVFQQNMDKFGSAYHGGNEKVGYYELRGLSTLDIDREEDFRLVEAIIMSKNQAVPKVEYYGDASIEFGENNVESILQKDGVLVNELGGGNEELVNINEVIDSKDSSKSWSCRLVNTESNCMTLISQLPGEGNRLHYHPDWNEWWYIVDGNWEWEIEGETRIVKKGDLVFMAKNRWHKITAMGTKPAIRMAVSRDDVIHVYRLGNEFEQ